ncbi:MAG: MotA/TolQ/ExbB proton channel family protein [Deltaproteobacteria bacterium]|nr:MotA/TolQ/ExbB proton channel family protein [Deltaproteobacteria bacterium]
MLVSSIESLYARGGITFFVIILLSIVALGIGIERWYATLTYRRRLELARDRILSHLREQKTTMAQAVNTTLPLHPATSLFSLLLDNERRTSNGEIKRLQGRIIRAIRRRLWMLASIGAIAPFVGLFGTVVGVMEAFQQISAQGTGGFTVVSGGISSALIATAGGIFVGIEAVILFNYLQVYVGEYTALLKEAVEEIRESIAEVEGGVSGS